MKICGLTPLVIFLSLLCCSPALASNEENEAQLHGVATDPSITTGTTIQAKNAKNRKDVVGADQTVTLRGETSQTPINNIKATLQQGTPPTP